MGLFTHEIERSSLVPGDHIYTLRKMHTYSHHGIYIGEESKLVIHFNAPEKKQGSKGPSFLISSSAPTSSSRTSTKCPIPDCGFGDPENGVSRSCLDCFLHHKEHSLHRYDYGLAESEFKSRQFRGGTCTTAKSDPPEEVIKRANYLLRNNVFGKYHLLKNNCEDFAIYCKTSLCVPLDGETAGKSGQAARMPRIKEALLSSSAKSFVKSPLRATKETIKRYRDTSYEMDIGVRPDAIPVAVENLEEYYTSSTGRTLLNQPTTNI